MLQFLQISIRLLPCWLVELSKFSLVFGFLRNCPRSHPPPPSRTTKCPLLSLQSYMTLRRRVDIYCPLYTIGKDFIELISKVFVRAFCETEHYVYTVYGVNTWKLDMI
jgi:hypothetical protein